LRETGESQRIAIVTTLPQAPALLGNNYGARPGLLLAVPTNLQIDFYNFILSKGLPILKA
jgi:hypothetical protein